MPKMTCKAVSSCGPTDAKLSQKVNRYQSLVAKFSQDCTGLPLFSHPLRGKTFETRWWSSGVWGNGSLHHEAAALQPLVTFLHVEPETVWLSQIKSYLSGGDNQVSYSCWLDKNRNGNGIEGLLILGAFFLESSWWIDALCSSKRLKALLLILCIVKYAGWMDCLL